jgi:transcriptional regulator EpsA
MMEDEILIKSRTQLDALLVNMETAVKVKRRSDFFSWVQGVFQALVVHEILICVLFDPDARSYRVESMSSHPLDAQLLASLCGTSDGLVYRLMALWERGGRQPIAISASAVSDPLDESLASEIRRLELGEVLAHGVPSLNGRAAGFFCFSRLVDGLDDNSKTMLELVAPYLHAAWTRANCDANKQEGSATLSPKILTSREMEILVWVEQGKSNNEIAQILNISHLTVKNHIQKILRKLNVQNRAQAVGKRLTLGNRR